MSIIKYNKDRNEVEIFGCSTCPFGFETPRADADCELEPNLSWYTGLPDYFPNGCPLRDPNFKLTRHIEE